MTVITVIVIVIVIVLSETLVVSGIVKFTGTGRKAVVAIHFWITLNYVMIRSGSVFCCVVLYCNEGRSEGRVDSFLFGW